MLEKFNITVFFSLISAFSGYMGWGVCGKQILPKNDTQNNRNFFFCFNKNVRITLPVILPSYDHDNATRQHRAQA